MRFLGLSGQSLRRKPPLGHRSQGPFRRGGSSRRLRLELLEDRRLLAVGPSWPQPANTAGPSYTIAATGRVDMVCDTKRDLLYISTNAGSVLRYDLSARAMLTPFQLGGSLMGIDISPDQNTLVVADSSYSGSTSWIDVVDLTTGVSRKIDFTQASGQGGTYSVAFIDNNTVLVSSGLREVNLTTGTTIALASVGQDTMLSASADHSVVAYAQAGVLPMGMGRYRVSDGNIAKAAAIPWFEFETAASRNGQQYAVPTYDGTYVYNQNLQQIGLIGTYANQVPIGVAYSPVADVVYFAWAGGGHAMIDAYNTKTLNEVATIDNGAPYAWIGNEAFVEGRLKVSSDGTLLFATVPGGVNVYAIATATTTAVSTSQASVTYGTSVSFTAVVSASTGTVAPSQGSVDFKDATTNTDLGNGTFVSSSGTTSTWIFTTGIKTFNVTPGDTIQATYSPGDGFGASSGSTTQAVTALPIVVTAVAATKSYDGTTSSTAAPTIGDVVTTLAGAAGQTGSSDGSGTAARFHKPEGVAVDSAGNVYVADYLNQTIRKISPAGVVATLAGSAGQSGSSNGTGTAALFHNPQGVAVDSAGNVYVADEFNDEIRKITPSGVVTILAGSTLPGSANGTGTAARFSSPEGVAVDSGGNVYVADTANQEIRKVTPAGVVTTLAGSAGHNGSSDGTGTAALFHNPQGVAVDSAGNVYVADEFNDEIRKITPSGVVTTFAGSAGQTGASDGSGTAARFFYPTGVAVDGAGNVYVADQDNQEIRQITPSGGVTTLAGSAGHQGTSNGSGSAARFSMPTGVAADGAGNVYVADSFNNEIRAIATTSLVGGDTPAFSETYGAKNAGTGLMLTPSGSVNDGNGGQNYAVTFLTSTTGVITKAPLTITAPANTKTYDGTAIAAATPTVAGLVGSDTVTGLSETYDNKNAGTGKTLAVAASYAVNDGNGGANYAVTTAGSTAGAINQAPLMITAAANTKPYDGTTSAAATPTVAGLAGSDTATGLSETYDTPAIGTGKTLTVAAGYVVNDGNSGNNYAVTTVPNTTGVIAVFNTATSLITSSGSVVYGTPVAFTAAVSASTGTVAPTQGSVDFKDTTTGADFGNGAFVTSSGTSSTWTFTTGVKTFNVTTGDTIQASYAPGTGFTASSGTTTQAVIALPIIVTAAASTKTYDGTASSAAVPTIGDVVTTLAGSAAQTGSSDDSGSAARFDRPDGVVVDSSGNVYVADGWNDEIRKISPSGVVTTLAGSAGQSGSSDGSGSARAIQPAHGCGGGQRGKRLRGRQPQ